MLSAMSGRFVAFVMIAGLLAGCGGSVGDRPHTGPVSSVPTADPTTSVTHSAPPSPARPTIPADVPRTGPNLKYKGEQPPVMPVAATQHTQAGAVAFAEFFIKTMDWGYASVSSTYMRHYFTAACKICDGLADGIDGIRQKHQHVYGNRFDTSASTAMAGGANGAEYSTDVKCEVTSAEIVDSRGMFVDGQPALSVVERVGARWSHDQWTAVSLAAIV
jgi:hypothetical protein